MTTEKVISKLADPSAKTIEQPKLVERPETPEQQKSAELKDTGPADEEPAVEDRLSHEHSIQVQTVQTVQKEDPFADNKSGAGLAASIHAPNSLSDSSIPVDFRNFHPTHNRSHTVGRPPSLRNNAYAANPRFSRSGASTPHQPYSHTRNHSSPPAGMNHRSPHTTRPVITGDAISRLARTIGHTTDSSPRTSVVTSSIE
jgi:hypothetical protein